MYGRRPTLGRKTPCGSTGGVHDAPARTEAAADSHTEYETVARHVEACPDCAERVVDGQGLLTCTDCDWTATVA